jgi:hypothetical protein
MLRQRRDGHANGKAQKGEREEEEGEAHEKREYDKTQLLASWCAYP